MQAHWLHNGYGTGDGLVGGFVTDQEAIGSDLIAMIPQNNKKGAVEFQFTAPFYSGFYYVPGRGHPGRGKKRPGVALCV